MDHTMGARLGGRSVAIAALTGLLAVLPALPAGAGVAGMTAGSIKSIPGHIYPTGVGCVHGKAVGSSTCYVTGAKSGSSAGLDSPVVDGAPKTPITIKYFGSSIACTSTTTCLVAATGQNVGELEWLSNGKVVKTVTLANSTYLYSVACETSTTCVVVGQGGAGTAYGVIATVTESDSTDTAVEVPGTAAIENVACPTSTTCYGVGTTAFTSSALGVAFAISGGVAGTLQDAAGFGGFEHISCGSSTVCWAIGYATSGKYLLDRIASGVPGPKLASPSLPGAIACVNGTTCLLTSGTSRTGHGIVDEIASGKVVSSHTFTGFKDGVLTAVTCPTATSCIVTGPTAVYNLGKSDEYYTGGVARVTL